MTTNRAVTATWNVVTAADRAERSFVRLMQRSMQQLEYKQIYFPDCMAAEYANEAARHQQVAESLLRQQAEAHEAERALAAEMHVTVSELREISREAYEFGHNVAGFDQNIWEHRVMATVAMVGETDKDVRKGVWYWSPSTCDCVTCSPVEFPPPPPVRDFPNKIDLFGEQGADW